MRGYWEHKVPWSYLGSKLVSLFILPNKLGFGIESS